MLSTLLLSETAPITVGLFLLAIPLLGVCVLLFKLSASSSLFLRIIGLSLSFILAVLGYLLLTDLNFFYVFLSWVPLLYGLCFILFFRKESSDH